MDRSESAVTPGVARQMPPMVPAKGPRMSKSIDDRGRGARPARRRRGPKRASSTDVTRGPETATQRAGMDRPRGRPTCSFADPKAPADLAATLKKLGLTSSDLTSAKHAAKAVLETGGTNQTAKLVRHLDDDALFAVRALLGE